MNSLICPDLSFCSVKQEALGAQPTRESIHGQTLSVAPQPQQSQTSNGNMNGHNQHAADGTDQGKLVRPQYQPFIVM